MTTNRTPAEMFVGQQLRTWLDLMRPAVDEGVRSQQAQQKAAHDQHCSNREFHIGQQVMARNFRQGPLWLPGIIPERLGPLTYLVEMNEDRSWKRHVDQLRVQGDSPQDTLMPTSDMTEPIAEGPEFVDEEVPYEQLSLDSTTTEEPKTGVRYPQRERRPPDRYHP